MKTQNSSALCAREWWLALAVVQVLGLTLTYLFGRDLNWDQFNYHFYAGLSVFHDRVAQDFFPASVQSYFNPLAYAPFYWLVNAGAHSYIVAAVHAVVHGLNVVLLYAIARQVLPNGVRGVRVTAVLATCLGCASALFVGGFGTTFMDLSTSVPVLAAVALLLASPSSGRLPWWPGVLLGVAVGLKLTNVVYALAAGITVLCFAGGLKRAVAGASALTVGAVGGFLVTYGVWGWRLFREFGSPMFPYFNGVFRAPEYSPTSMNFDRFVPHSWDDWLLFPLRLVELRSWLYTESVAADLRPLAALMLAVAAVVVLWRKRAARAADVPDAADRRAQHMLLVFAAVSAVAWMATSGNGRYGLPWFMLLGPILALLATWALPARWLQGALALLLVAQLVHVFSVGNPRWNPQPWASSWYDAEVPERLKTQPHLYLSVGTQSNSFVAGLVHPQSSFMNVVGQHSLGLDGPEGPRVRQMLDKHAGRTRMLVRWSEAPVPAPDSGVFNRVNSVLDRLLLRVNTTDCGLMSVDGGGAPTELALFGVPSTSGPKAGRYVMLSCALERKAQRDASIQAAQDQVQRVLDAYASRCPRLLRPAGTIAETSGRGIVAYYMETGIYMGVLKDRLFYYAERQPVDTDLGPLAQWEENLQKFDCRRPRDGSREF